MISYEDIKPYIEKKLVSEQSHPANPDVRIFNYTQHCQFEQAWDDVTRQCRGLILNVATGEVIARPFPKFFNYGEHVSKGWAIPTTTPVVQEKLDGSLGILYMLDGKPWIATRGSFSSEQAVWATKWYRENVEEGEHIEPGITNLFEIIYPENRIVVGYDFSGLVHLASILNETGETVDVNWDYPIRKPQTYGTTDVTALAAMDEPEGEGFVVFYPEENVRMKIKFPEYVRLHKLVTGISEIAIWEHLREMKPLEGLLERVPDEFFNWVNGVQERLSTQFNEIAADARVAVDIARAINISRKDQADAIKRNTKYPGVAFAMLDGKDFADIIWRSIRPRGQSSFKTDIDL